MSALIKDLPPIPKGYLFKGLGWGVSYFRWCCGAAEVGGFALGSRHDSLEGINDVAKLFNREYNLRGGQPAMAVTILKVRDVYCCHNYRESQWYASHVLKAAGWKPVKKFLGAYGNTLILWTWIPKEKAIKTPRKTKKVK